MASTSKKRAITSSASSNRRTCIATCILATSILVADGRAGPGGRDGGPTTLVTPPWKHTLGVSRFRQFHLTTHGGFSWRIGEPRGLCAVKLRSQDKEGKKDDDEVTVFGVNGGRGEIIYNSSLYSLDRFVSGQDGVGELAGAEGIAADADGRVMVADPAGDRVVRFHVDTEMGLHYDGDVTLEGTGAALSGPRGIATGSGAWYVADTGNDRIVVLDGDGRFNRSIGEGRLSGPSAIAVIDSDAHNFYQSSFVVVVDSSHSRLTKLAPSGALFGGVTVSEVTDRDARFDYVAIDFYANVFVTDSRSGCVFKFDRYLNYLTRFECDGEPGGKLDEPRGIAINRRFGQVFIAENTGVSYYWIGTDVRNPSARPGRDPGRPAVSVQFVLTEQSTVTIDVIDDDGDVSEVLYGPRFTPPGLYRREFAVGPETIDCDVADCTYRVRVRARATYASRRHLEVERIVPIR